MDVLNPPLEEIDGIMYRINPVDHLTFNTNAEFMPYLEHGFDDDELECMNDIVESEDEQELDIEILPNKKYRIQFHVPKLMHYALVGHKGSTRQRLEADTKTFIRIPRLDENGNIVVTGRLKRNVVKAYQRIQMLVATTRAKQQYTHFISLPTNVPRFQETFLHFKADVLQRCSNDRGVQEDIFQFPERLHLTFAILVLADDLERKAAVKMLEKCKESVIDPLTGRKPIRLHVRGLGIMNDDPSEVSVLYGKVFSDNDLLQKLADEIASYFNKSDLTIRPRDNVKLHVTFMNTSFLFSRKLETEPTRQSYHRATFDATAILDNFGDFDFGEFEVNSVHLSQSHTKGADGYYISSAKIYFS